MAEIYLRAAIVGCVAGMRTFTAPVFTSRYLARRASRGAASSPLRLFGQAAGLLSVAAAAELVVDKLPSTPDRISPPSLAARGISGAICGAAIFASHRENAGAGAVLGALAAISSAFATFHIRRHLSRHAPALSVALAEDMIAVAAATRILKH